MKLMTLTLVSLLTVVPLFAQEAEEMITKSYRIDVPIGPFGAMDGFSGHPRAKGGSSVSKPRKEDKDVLLRKSFEQALGMSFPEGSSLEYKSLMGVVTMTNTRLNHELLYAGLITGGNIPRLVQIQMRILSFDSSLVAALERKYPAGIPDQKILDLWSSGNGESLAATSVKTLNGVNAIIECVREVIYPTEIGVETEEEGVIERLGFAGFETRDVGIILNVTPTISMTGIINLVVLPEAA